MSALEEGVVSTGQEHGGGEGKGVLVEVGCAGPVEPARDLDGRDVHVGHLELVHGWAQAHLDALQSLVDYYDTLETQETDLVLSGNISTRRDPQPCDYEHSPHAECGQPS